MAPPPSPSLLARDQHGRTPLWLAVSGNHLATTSLLLDAGADPRVVDTGGHGVLGLARSQAVRDLVARALDNGTSLS